MVLANAVGELAGERDGLRLPDSGRPDIIIAPDLPNLPKGQKAVDTDTGEEYQGHA